MSKLFTDRLFIIACIVSVLIHICLFAGLCVVNDLPPKNYDKTYSSLYNVSLEYVYLPPENPIDKVRNTNKIRPAARENEYQNRGKNKYQEKTNPDNSLTTELPLKECEQAIFPDTGDIPGISATHSFTNDSDNKKSDDHVSGQTGKQYHKQSRDIVFTELGKKIKENTVYPPAAKRRGIEGTVTIVFIIDRQGRLARSEVKESSGYRILDKAALEVIDRVLPYPHTLGSPVEMKISIVYELH